MTSIEALIEKIEQHVEVRGRFTSADQFANYIRTTLGSVDALNGNGSYKVSLAYSSKISFPADFELSTNAIVQNLVERSNGAIRIINDTPLAGLLERITFDNFQTADGQALYNKIFTGGAVSDSSFTSYNNALWGAASDRFVHHTQGAFANITPESFQSRVYADVEVPRAFASQSIDQFNGLSRAEAFGSYEASNANVQKAFITNSRPDYVIFWRSNMSIILKSRSLTAILSAIAALSFTTFASANPFLIDENDGTYKTETVTSTEQCQALCKAESETCRGTIILQMDVTKPEMLCRLNNGKGDNPAFPSVAPDPFDISIALSDFNAYRAQNGLGPVKLNGKLTLASKLHAEDMMRFGDATHTGTDGSSHSDRVQRQAYYFSIAAENVAAGQKSWEKVFKAWQNSPSHNVNLLREDVTDFGIGTVYDPESSFGTFWAMLVAAPLEGHIQDAMARGDEGVLAKLIPNP